MTTSLSLKRPRPVPKFHQSSQSDISIFKKSFGFSISQLIVWRAPPQFLGYFSKAPPSRTDVNGPTESDGCSLGSLSPAAILNIK